MAGDGSARGQYAASYPLAIAVEHMRRPQASTLLFSMAKHALRLEQRGRTIEFFQGCLTIEGDYWSVYGVDLGLTPEQFNAGVHARDDEPPHDGVIDEQAELQRRQEAFRVAERARLAKRLGGQR